MLGRPDKSFTSEDFSNVSEYYAQLRNGLKEKADHNKRESQAAFYAVICFTLTSPLFVTLGTGYILGKVVPATLSVLAAGATSWLQLRKPQRLWAIYRRAQRELEREKVAYDFGLGDYLDVDGRDKILASRTSEIAFRVHEQWEGLVPEPDLIASSTPYYAPKPAVSTNDQ